jgi:hypothetical protein
VRRLHLTRNEITTSGVRALAAGRLGALIELDLRYNALDELAARALIDAPFAGALERLVMYRNDVGPAGARALASSDRLSPAVRSYWRSV